MQQSNFNNNLSLKNGEISYHQNIFSKNDANTNFYHLLKETNWKQDIITVFGKKHLQPRLTALYGEKPYSYSNLKMTPEPFTPFLLNIKNKVEELSNSNFNVCLLNLYRDGNDSNGWHSDNESSLGKNPTIASLSFGQDRYFYLRNIQNKKLKYKLLLEHNSLLIMEGQIQHFWQHQIPKTKRKIEARINLTFRTII